MQAGIDNNRIFPCWKSISRENCCPLIIDITTNVFRIFNCGFDNFFYNNNDSKFSLNAKKMMQMFPKTIFHFFVAILKQK